MTGLLSYEFDTTNLAIGTYALSFWIQPFDITLQHPIEIVDPGP